MTPNENTYQSVLYRLSRIPVEALAQIDAYLENFVPENGSNPRNREAILALAGGWDEMSESDFQE